MDISKHRLLKQCYDLCLAIEECGASQEVTDALTMAGHLMTGINEYVFHAEEMPLRCRAENGTIEMGVSANVLCFAAGSLEALWDGESPLSEPIVKITDRIAFAEAVAEAINHEEEDGGTLLTRMLDEAIMAAVEDGCDGVDHDA